MPKFSDSPLMWMERAATSKSGHIVAAALWNIVSMLALHELWLWYYSVGLFGVKRYGVHVNGYTVSDGGEVSMWLARRSATKQTYPGLLDNVVRTSKRHKTVTQQLFFLLKSCSELEALMLGCHTNLASQVPNVTNTGNQERTMSLLPHWSAD